jgi:GDSL-like Lipase/Acylhydrolase family
MMKKNKWYNTLLVITSVIVSILMVEAGLRVVGYGKLPPSESAFKFFQYDPVCSWRNMPGAEGDLRMVDSVSHIKINSHGLRSDKNYPYAKGDKPRIAIMGDSFTWGYGVSNGNTFSDILEEDYQGQVEVLNAGVCGYGTDQELLLYENDIRKYHPDVVIITMNLTDILNDNNNHGSSKAHFERDRNGGLRLTNIPVPVREKNRFTPHLLIPSKNELLVIKFLQDRLVSFPFIADIYLKYLLRVGKVDLELSKAIVNRFAATVAADRGKLIVFIFPSLGEIKRGRPTFLLQQMIMFLKENQISFFYPHEAFKEASKTTNLYFTNDRHPNEAGHKIAAKELYGFLRGTVGFPSPSF